MHLGATSTAGRSGETSKVRCGTRSPMVRRKVVLVGYSMGGAITASFLQQSSLASKVTKVVLDSPMLDLGRTIDYGAEQLELPVMGSPPTSLVWVAKQIAAARYDVDWEAVDYLDAIRPGSPSPPWCSRARTTFGCPLKTADQLRAAKPDLVTLVEVEDAGHIEAWNKDPQTYDRKLTAFLAQQ